MVLAYNAEEGSFQLVDSVPSVVGEQASENTCADIHISPDGKFIYGSNRGCDTLVIYRVDAATGKLSYVGTQSSGGKTPRNFAIDPTGELLFSANQDTDNIVVYKIDRENGTLSKLSETKVPTPVCVKAYEW